MKFSLIALGIIFAFFYWNSNAYAVACGVSGTCQESGTCITTSTGYGGGLGPLCSSPDPGQPTCNAKQPGSTYNPKGVCPSLIAPGSSTPYTCCEPAPAQGGLAICSDFGGVCSPRGGGCQIGYVATNNPYDCPVDCCRPLSCSDLSDTQSFCGQTGRSSYPGRTFDYANNPVSNTCPSGLCFSTLQSCNGGDTQTGGCVASNPPANTCGTYPGTYQMTKTSYVHANCGDTSGYTCASTTSCIQNSYYPACTTGFINNCSTNYTCSGGSVCTTNIFVYVYTDYNHSGTNNGGGKSGVTITDNGGNYPVTDGSGNVTFSGKTTGNYTITETVPNTFQATNATSQGVSLTNTNGNATVNFYLTPLYTLSGRVFNDTNKNQKFDSGSETGYTGGGTIHLQGPTTLDIPVAADGTWTSPVSLLSGTYMVSFNGALTPGYKFTTPSSWSVTLGNPQGTPVCSPGASPDASCGGVNNGSLANLNIGVSNNNPWKQSVCLDTRDDSITYSNPIPANPSCGGVTGAYDTITNASCSTGAGIVFTCTATPDFGLGSSNALGWQAGGNAPNNECFTGAGMHNIRTSYDYLATTAKQANITPTDLSLICGGGGLSSCTLPPTLSKGIYIAYGDLSLNSYTFPVDPLNPQAFIFMINGNLHLQGNILVPAGSVAAFSASGSIYVDPSVGNVVTNPSDPSVNTPNIEGLYSADANFIVQSYGSGAAICNANGTPLDKKLNIVGSVITNAGLLGGSFQNNRDLCIYDSSCPSYSVGDSNGLALSYILTLMADGGFMSHRVFNWQEMRP